MPFTSAELAQIGISSINLDLKNKPIDQVSIDHPFLKKLMAKRRSFPGGKQYVVEKLLKSYDSNFQFYFGPQAVTYKKKEILAQSEYPWGGAHDGFQLDEDTLLANGITIDDGKPRSATGSEKVQLRNILEDNIGALRTGFDELFEYNLFQDGTQGIEAIAGLDYLISTNPAVGVVGGIDGATNPYWQNHVNTGIAPASLISAMEIEHRKCRRNGGAPTDIFFGSNMLDTFRTQAKAEISRYTVLNTGGQSSELDPSITGLHFHGTPITWVPAFENLDTNLAPAIAWEDRGYFFNSNNIRLRPAMGHDMITRDVPREYNRYVLYWAMTWKGAMTCNRRNANSLFSL